MSKFPPPDHEGAPTSADMSTLAHGRLMPNALIARIRRDLPCGHLRPHVCAEFCTHDDPPGLRERDAGALDVQRLTAEPPEDERDIDRARDCGRVCLPTFRRGRAPCCGIAGSVLIGFGLPLSTVSHEAAPRRSPDRLGVRRAARSEQAETPSGPPLHADDLAEPVST